MVGSSGFNLLLGGILRTDDPPLHSLDLGPGCLVQEADFVMSIIQGVLVCLSELLVRSLGKHSFMRGNIIRIPRFEKIQVTFQFIKIIADVSDELFR